MQAWHDIHFTSRDGLRLYARHYPAPGSDRRPVLCLAGLTRNSKDFHDLALALSQPDDEGRDVYTLDCRGRGRSEHDRNWNNYSLLVEVNDVLDFTTVTGLHDAAVIGTSRGGLLAMIAAVLRPNVIGAVILNDIGPVIERQGLARIMAYVGRIPLPKDWQEAAKLAREMNERQFPAVSDEDWAEYSHAWLNEVNGLPAPGYDPNISKPFSVMDGPIPELWPQFGALLHVPVMVIRGENSDILGTRTVEEMRARHPKLTAVTVPGQGHAPLLKDAPTIAAIVEFLARADHAPQRATRAVPALA